MLTDDDSHLEKPETFASLLVNFASHETDVVAPVTLNVVWLLLETLIVEEIPVPVDV
jgi:hypothetical protein